MSASAAAAVNGGSTEVRVAIRVLGVRVMDASFFLLDSSSTLVASPTAHIASCSRATSSIGSNSKAAKGVLLEGIQSDISAASWAQGLGDLDFILYDASTNQQSPRGSPLVDYSFLSYAESPAMPPRVRGETPAERVVVLSRWIEKCRMASMGRVLGTQLARVCPTLGFEFDSFLSNLREVGAGGGRATTGVVSSGGSDGSHTVALVIPLLLKESDAVRATLTNISTFYASAVRMPWSKQHNTIIAAEFDLHIRFSVVGGRETVSAERLSVHMEDSSPDGHQSFVPFLCSCIDLASLPQCSSTSVGGSRFMDYIPRLEAALFKRLRQPLHFMSLVLSLCSYFGEPIDLCPACKDLDGTTNPGAMVSTAVFGIVDRTTECSFMLGLHYYSGTEMPSMGLLSSQYLSMPKGTPVRAKVKYAVGPADIAKDSDGFLKAADVCEVVAESTIACAAQLLASLP